MWRLIEVAPLTPTSMWWVASWKQDFLFSSVQNNVHPLLLLSFVEEVEPSPCLLFCHSLSSLGVRWSHASRNLSSLFSFFSPPTCSDSHPEPYGTCSVKFRVFLIENSDRGMNKTLFTPNSVTNAEEKKSEYLSSRILSIFPNCYHKILKQLCYLKIKTFKLFHHEAVPQVIVPDGTTASKYKTLLHNTHCQRRNDS